MSVLSYKYVVRDIIRERLVFLTKGSSLFSYSSIVLTNIIDYAANNTELFIQLLYDSFLDKSSINISLSKRRVLTNDILGKNNWLSDWLSFPNVVKGS